ncbi:MAG: ribonuclease HII [Oscillospiraceae bacterium]|nr:ribonuclease HII [Oscillospiraceae bacterium]
MDLWKEEREYISRGIRLICGVDEAGAGPLAGPVCAAAVILPAELEIPGLNDSKKLTEKKREALFPVIQEQAVAWAVAWATAEEIDEINILQARLLAMSRAVAQLDPAPELALVDGNRAPQLPISCVTLVQGDGRSANIAAASVLAKVSRDRYMLELAKQYPQYAFEKHKGYPTKLHYERLREFGPSPVHRRTFLKNL